MHGLEICRGPIIFIPSIFILNASNWSARSDNDYNLAAMTSTDCEREGIDRSQRLK
jgi:hypothetical protein